MHSKPARPFTCRLCGLSHQQVPLAPGEVARCIRCGTVLAIKDRLGPDAPLAFTLAALALGLASMVLPLVTVHQLGNSRDSMIYSGAGILWKAGMAPLAVVVIYCSVVSPALLLVAMLGLLIPSRLGWSGRAPTLRRFVGFLTEWAYPEVQLLAMVVAFVKLADLVKITLQPGLWCYGAMSIALVLAYRCFEFSPAASEPTTIAEASANKS